jgi:outer membrane protein TolC
MQILGKCLLLCVLAGEIAACTVHPPGEQRERAAVEAAGRPYVRPIESRTPPVLAADATPEDLVTYALITNAGLEQKYWEWRSALEQVPQEGTQKTSLMVTFDSMITNGSTAAAMNTLGLGNDPMNNLVLPDKLATAARAALDRARAAGRRFDQAHFDLRARVLTAYADYALAGELLRLERSNRELLHLILQVTQSRLSTGAAMQQDLLKAANEEALSSNESQVLGARLAQDRAALNALLNRSPSAPLEPPKGFPAVASVAVDDAAVLAAAARENPELQALSLELAAGEGAVRRAKEEYLPEFGITASTDLAGATQSLMGSVMVPMLRYQAIDAGIRQAQANLRAAEAKRAQASHDLASRLVADLTLVHDIDRQMEVYERTILPRAEQAVTTSQSAFSTGRSTLLELLDAQRSLVGLRRMVAELKASRSKQAADIEAGLGMPLSKEAVRGTATGG